MNAFVLNNTVGKGRLLFVASHGQGPVNNVVISGNRLVGHSMTIDSLAPERSPRRSNWVVVDNVSDTPVQQRVMRFFRTDGLEVHGNRQPVAKDEPAIVLDAVCGAHISDNDFGTDRIRQVTPVCAASLTVPDTVGPSGSGETARVAHRLDTADDADHAEPSTSARAVDTHDVVARDRELGWGLRPGRRDLRRARRVRARRHRAHVPRPTASVIRRT